MRGRRRKQRLTLVHCTRSTAINHSITYSVIAAEPALTFSSVVSKIELQPITSGPLEGSTFVSWSGNFSSDAGELLILLSDPLRSAPMLRSRCKLASTLSAAERFMLPCTELATPCPHYKDCR